MNLIRYTVRLGILGILVHIFGNSPLVYKIKFTLLQFSLTIMSRENWIKNRCIELVTSVLAYQVFSHLILWKYTDRKLKKVMEKLLQLFNSWQTLQPDTLSSLINIYFCQYIGNTVHRVPQVLLSYWGYVHWQYCVCIPLKYLKTCMKFQSLWFIYQCIIKWCYIQCVSNKNYSKGMISTGIP